jgi:diguanylate cyclase (GGDEF)-like protein/PAS domain S-box-containing protein
MSLETNAITVKGSLDGRRSLLRNALPMICSVSLLISFFFLLCALEVRKVVADDTDCVAIMLLPMTAILILSIRVVIACTTIHPVQAVSSRLHALDVESDESLSPPHGHEADEIGRLVRDTNEMVSRLRTSLGLQHELHLQCILDEKLRLPAKIFENSPNGIFITDRENHIARVNRSFIRITGYTEEEVLGRNPRFLASGRHDRIFYEKMWKRLLTFGTWKGEIWDRRKDGEIKPGWFGISVVHNDKLEIANYVAIFTDTSERKSAEERLDFLAHHDALTQLPNRVLARERFHLALAMTKWDDRSVALLRLDLDGFKYVNETFGYAVGDQLLVMVGERLRNLIRGTDTVSRESGDEYMILLPGIRDIKVLRRICTHFLDKLADPIEIAGHTISISASIGVAFYPRDGGDFDTLLRKADVAMYVAKNTGKNTYRLFAEGMDVDALDKLKLRADLANALENNEIHIVFQPQLDLATNQIMGTEVLCRWTHPERGPISPAHFIPVAEESGLIGRLGEWVLRQACAQGKRWFDFGIPPFIVAVNISIRQVNHGDLVGTVRKILAESGFPAEYLELELSEAGLLDDMESLLEVINQLKALGVRLSIDDFGTGCSSLNHLRRFGVDRLKIDQSFIHDMEISDHETETPRHEDRIRLCVEGEGEGENLAIVRAIIQMAQSLRLPVIAEGVETEKQKNVLIHLGCHEIQGYLISKPLSHQDLKDFIIRWNVRDVFPEAVIS